MQEIHIGTRIRMNLGTSPMETPQPVHRFLSTQVFVHLWIPESRRVSRDSRHPCFSEIHIPIATPFPFSHIYYGSFHFLFQYPYITPIYYGSPCPWGDWDSASLVLVADSSNLLQDSDLDPKSMYNNGPYGCYSGVRAIILYTFGV